MKGFFHIALFLCYFIAFSHSSWICPSGYSYISGCNDTNARCTSSSFSPILTGNYCIEGSQFVIDSSFSVEGSLSVQAGSLNMWSGVYMNATDTLDLTLQDGDNLIEGRIYAANISLTGDGKFELTDSAVVSASALGPDLSQLPDYPWCPTLNDSYRTGGSHAGEGGYTQWQEGLDFTPFGSLTGPYTAGCPGTSGNGGGVIRISSQLDIMIFDGASITADGYGNSAGGSIHLIADHFANNGTLSADGGTSSPRGGGGRIAIHAHTRSQESPLAAPTGSSPGTLYHSNDTSISVNASTYEHCKDKCRTNLGASIDTLICRLQLKDEYCS